MNIPSRLFRQHALRVAVLALCTGALGATAMRAQDAPPPTQGQDGPRRGGGGPEQQARQLDMMTRELKLTPDQVTQIKAIQVDGRAQMMALRDDTSTAQQDKRARMMAMRETEQSKIKAVLTDDQKVKFDAMMEKMRERRQHGNGGDGQGPPPPPSN